MSARGRAASRGGGTATWIALGGIAGAGARWAVVEAASDAHRAWAVLAVNLAGSLLLGVVVARWVDTPTGAAIHLRLAVSTGFCGALTTFSTLAVDLGVRMRAGNWADAVAWGVGAVLAGVAAAAVGALAERIWRRRRDLGPATGTGTAW